MNIVLVDANLLARREAVLKATAAEIEPPLQLGIRQVVPEYAPQFLSTLPRDAKALVLVPIDENRLSGLTDGTHIPRVPCPSIRLGYELIQLLEDRDMAHSAVVFVIPACEVTGVDVLTLLLSGAGGVLDLSALGSGEALHTIVSVLNDRPRNDLLLIGAPSTGPYALLYNTVSLFDYTLRIASGHFGLLAALAEMPLMRLPIKKGNKPSDVDVARELEKYVSVTGYTTNDSTRRKVHEVLVIVSEILADDSDEGVIEEHSLPASVENQIGLRQLARDGMLDLSYLPVYARALGFPACLLPIRGQNDSNLINLLHRGITRVRPKSTTKPDGLVYGRARIDSLQQTK